MSVLKIYDGTAWQEFLITTRGQRKSIYTPQTGATDWAGSQAKQTFNLKSGEALTDYDYVTFSGWVGNSASAKYAFTMSCRPTDLRALSGSLSYSFDLRIHDWAGGWGLVARNTDSSALLIQSAGTSAQYGKVFGIWGGSF